MSELFTYLIKANIAIALFYLIYHFWLRNLTFYRINRYFLIFSLAFSMLYPLVDWSWFQSTPTLSPEAGTILPAWEYQYTESQQVNISKYLVYVFYLTLLVFGLRLGISLLGIWRIHLLSTASVWKVYAYRKSDEDILPFSFWKNVYLNPDKHQENELEGIFRHEYVHVRQMHSIDILLSEIVLIFCWYNPCTWLFRRVIKENIEFITDNNVLASGIDKQEYQYSLLTVLGNNTQPKLANFFNIQSLKKRICMMNKKQTSKFHMVKYAVLVPIIIGCLSLVTITQAKQQPHSSIPGISSVANWNSKKADKVIIDTVVDKGDQIDKVTIVDTVTTVKKTNDKNAIGTAIVEKSRDTTIKRDSHHTIRLRSDNDESAKRPLFVVDGEIMDDYALTGVDPQDIESINVYKDDKATTLYGGRGKNGVIAITLKKKSGHDERQKGTLQLKGDVVGVSFDTSSVSNLPKKRVLDDQNVRIYIDGTIKTRKDLEKILPDNIAKIQVFQGKQAMEHYDVEDGQGVIIVTTKSANNAETKTIK